MSTGAAAALLAMTLTGCSGSSDAPVAQTGSDAAVVDSPVTSDGSPDAPVVTLAFAGDSYAEGPLDYRLQQDPDGFVGPFARTFRDADVAMLNLETAITTATTAEPKTYVFGTDERVLSALASGGIDIVSLANNHGMDFGVPGLEDSLAAKRSVDAPAIIGIGADEAEAFAPHIVEVEGQRIAFIAATQVLDDNLIDKWTAGPNKGGLASAKRVDRLTEEVAAVRGEVDTVVVFLHWGVELLSCPTTDQIELAEALKSAGADIIVGGHQHRLAGGGRMGNTFVNYGLGNFLFQAASQGAERTGVLTVAVRGREVVDYKWLPGRISNGVPQRLTGADKAAELAYWQSLRECSGLRP
jgi:poly-gamma-glutamate synthesis protein (capsule biosynthesis protein)